MSGWCKYWTYSGCIGGVIDAAEMVDSPVRTPYQAPIANSFVESWIGSLKRECLNTFFCFSLRQLDHIVQTYASYHNQYRPHQGLGNRPLGVPENPLRQTREIDAGLIRCKHWLGGMLKHYYRQAA